MNLLTSILSSSGPDRHYEDQIKLFCWSPTMDLLIVVTKKEELILSRLEGQIIWKKKDILKGPQQLEQFWKTNQNNHLNTTEIIISALTWKPDGRILAVGFEHGDYVLLDVEAAYCIHHHKFPSHHSEINKKILNFHWCEWKRGSRQWKQDYQQVVS